MKKIKSLILLFFFISSTWSSLSSMDWITKKENRASIGFSLGMAMVYALSKKYPQLLNLFKYSADIIFVIQAGKTTYDVIQYKKNRPDSSQTISEYDKKHQIILFADIEYLVKTLAFSVLTQYLYNNHYDNFTIRNALLTAFKNFNRKLENFSSNDVEKVGQYTIFLGLLGMLSNTLDKTKNNESQFDFEPIKTDLKFTDVAGAKEAKKALQTIVNMLNNPVQENPLQAKPPRGVLLVGKPGCGKTLLAKALAGEANCNFFNVSGSEFQLKWLGDGQTKIRNLFSKAKKNAPSIIFFDEFDTIAMKRDDDIHHSYAVTLNQLLIEMDGMESDDKIVVLAATNRPKSLDPGAIRPGRFDRKIKVENPKTPEERLEVLKVHTSKLPLDDNIDLQSIADSIGILTSAAAISTFVNQARINAYEENKDKIEEHHFKNALLTAKDSINALQ